MYPAHLNKKRTEDSGMYDNYQRNIDYFRISITDRCNLRCRYCMPEGIPLISMDQILRYEEILAICTEAVNSCMNHKKTMKIGVFLCFSY